MATTNGITTLYVTHPSTFGHKTWDFCRHGRHTDLAGAVACASRMGGEVGAACRCGSAMPCALGHSTVAIVRRWLAPGSAPRSVKTRETSCPSCASDHSLGARADGNGSVICGACGHETFVDGVNVIAVEVNGVDQASVIS